MKRPVASYLLVLAVGGVLVALAIALQQHNPRVLVSWHGFLHTAIANRFTGSFGTPENPFFAGEPLPYYWFHHYVSSLLANALGVHPVRAFQVFTATGLLTLWAGAAAIGIGRLKSLGAALLIGLFVLGGVNPLGLGIAVAKNLVQGQTLMTSPPDNPETVFAGEHESAALLTQPLLPAMYFSADWRRGQTLPFFLDSSSRGVALGLLIVLLFAFMGEKLRPGRLLTAAAIGALMAALNPLIGLASVGALCGGAVLLGLLKRVVPSMRGGVATQVTLVPALVAALGVAAAVPTFIHLFQVGGSGMHFQPARAVMTISIALALNVVMLLPLAVWACFRADGALRDQCLVMLFGACALLAVVPLISLSDDTEHNLANTAQTLLVVPAVVLLLSLRSRRAMVLVAALCIPTALGSAAAFTGRPSLPISIEQGQIHRTREADLDRLYQWIRSATPQDSIFVADPATPVKMSGNVSELPAFTARTLYVDLESYLTTPYEDFAHRQEVAARLTSGLDATAEDLVSVTALRRPTYLVSYHADDPNVRGPLLEHYGQPAFESGFVAVFDLAPLQR